MTLVVARKYQNQVCIVGDTKLSFPNEEIKGRKQDPSEGLIKSVIINQNICISFSGEVEFAEKALKSIDTNDSFDKIVNKILKSNRESQFRTDYIVCFGGANSKIMEVRDGNAVEKESSWIGDSNAFNKFQEYYLSDNSPKFVQQLPLEKAFARDISKPAQPSVNITGLNFNIEKATLEPFSKMSTAMDLTISDSSALTVGGFKTCVIYENGFAFNQYIQTYRGQFYLTGVGEQVIPHGSSEEGAYTLNFLNNSKDYNSVALHIKQGKFGIIYNRRDGGLLQPKIFRGSEIDFVDLIEKEYNIPLGFGMEDRSSNYNNLGVEEANKGNYKNAIEWFRKAVENTKNEKQKARYLLHQGYSEWLSGDKSKGFITLNRAQSLDQTLFISVTKFISSQNNRQRGK